MVVCIFCIVQFYSIPWDWPIVFLRLNFLRSYQFTEMVKYFSSDLKPNVQTLKPRKSLCYILLFFFKQAVHLKRWPVFTSFWRFLGHFWLYLGLYRVIFEHFGTKIGHFWVIFGWFWTIFGSIRGHLVVTWGSFWHRFGIIFRSFWCRFDPILRPFLSFSGYFWPFLAIFTIIFRPFLRSCRVFF